jgi:hypothetical protein
MFTQTHAGVKECSPVWASEMVAKKKAVFRGTQEGDEAVRKDGPSQGHIIVFVT